MKQRNKNQSQNLDDKIEDETKLVEELNPDPKHQIVCWLDIFVL